jgi:hypothetical protein
MLNSLSAQAPVGAEAEQLVNARPIWLCVVQFFCHSWFAASRKIRTDDLVDRLRGATC